jgi:hypothetical protein
MQYLFFPTAMKNSKVNIVNKSYKRISYLVPLFILVVAIGGGSCNVRADESNLPPETPYASNFYAADTNLSTDGYYSFTAFDQDIIYQKDVFDKRSDFVYVIPVSKGDILDINCSMSANATFLSTDFDGFADILAGTPEEITENLTKHILWEYSQDNSTTYHQRVVSNNDTYFYLAVLPSDLEQPSVGHITVTRYNQTGEAIPLGVNGTEIVAYYEALNAQTGQAGNTPNTQVSDAQTGTSTTDSNTASASAQDVYSYGYEPLQLEPPAYIPASMTYNSDPYGLSTEAQDALNQVEEMQKERLTDDMKYFQSSDDSD